MKKETCKLYRRGEMNGGCMLCEFYLDCCKRTGKAYRIFEDKTTRVNEFREGCTEVVIYKQPFKVLTDYGNLENTEIERNFIRVRNHPIYGSYLIPRTSDVRVQTLIDCLNRSKKRALDKYYSFARANEWKYFFTFTFDKMKVSDRYDDDECRYCWQLFRQKLQRMDPDVKLLCVPEYHTDKGEGVAMHFHGLIDTKLNFPLRPFKDPRTGKERKTKNGDPLFEFMFWDYGMATCAILPPGKDSPKVISYVQKYIVKGDGVGYMKRRYFATRNLAEKETFLLDEQETEQYLEGKELYLYKDDEKMRVYRSWKTNLDDDSAD